MTDHCPHLLRDMRCKRGQEKHNIIQRLFHSKQEYPVTCTPLNRDKINIVNQFHYKTYCSIEMEHINIFRNLLDSLMHGFSKILQISRQFSFRNCICDTTKVW